jgi:biotin synthase
MDINKKRFEKINGIPLENVFEEKFAVLKEYGLIEDKGPKTVLTKLGAFVADEVVESFNDDQFKPFPREEYADGVLNPYRHNSRAEALGIKKTLLATGAARENLFKKARETRKNIFGNELKVRGVIEISNACVTNCDYCAMRRDNKNLDRYTMDAETIVEIANRIKAAGIKTVFLQAGQNPAVDKILEEVIPKIKDNETEVLLCLGEKDKTVYEKYKALGADSYILKFESINLPDFEERAQAIADLKETGFKLGTGNICGLPGQTLDDLEKEILYAASLSPDFVSVSPLIPNEGAPLEKEPVGNIDYCLNAVAIWRILLPEALIPSVSAFSYIRPQGRLEALNAGANVVTINFTPDDLRDKYAIYAKDRFIVKMARVADIAEGAGLKLENVRL